MFLFWSGSIYRAKKEATWQSFEVRNKIIGLVQTYPNDQTVVRSPPLEGCQREKGV